MIPTETPCCTALSQGSAEPDPAGKKEQVDQAQDNGHDDARAGMPRSRGSLPVGTLCRNIIAIGANTPREAAPSMMAKMAPAEVPGVRARKAALRATEMAVPSSQAWTQKARVS